MKTAEYNKYKISKFLKEDECDALLRDAFKTNIKKGKNINFGKIADSVDKTLKDTEKVFKESLEG